MADRVWEVATVWLGKPLLVKMSDNETGYLNVLMQKDARRTKPFYAKYDPGNGEKQKTLNGSSSATAEEAACKLAYFLAGHGGSLPPKQSRTPRRPSVVRLAHASPAHICFSLSPTCARRGPAQEVKAEKMAKKAQKEERRAITVQNKIARLAARATPLSAVPKNVGNLPVVAAIPIEGPCNLIPVLQTIGHQLD